MSGSSNRPGAQGWIWSPALQEYYCCNPETGQYYVSRGRDLVQIAPPNQDPRLEQTISSSDVRDNSRPQRAGSASSVDASYSLYRGQPQSSYGASSNMRYQMPRTQPGGQYIAPSGSSTYGTSPPPSQVSGNRPASFRPSNVPQNPSQRPPDRSDGQTRRQPPYTTRARPTSTASQNSGPYSPEVPVFAPGLPNQSSYAPANPAVRSGNNPSNLERSLGNMTISPSTSHPTSGSIDRSSRPARAGEYFDPTSGVRSAVRFHDVPTDPTLRQIGVVANSFLLGTTGDQEQLWPDFKRRSKPRKFFTEGRVFVILWAEPAGESDRENTVITSREPSQIPGKFGQMVFSKVRRFIVIREADNYCSAISIMSYGDQGVGKPGVEKREHGIVYIGKQPPEATADEFPRRGEDGMMPQPVRVDPDQPGEKLTPMSRINYGKVYTIEHNLKVRPLGTINKESLQALHYQFRHVWERGMSGRRGSGIPGQGPSNTSNVLPRNPQTGYDAAIHYLISQGRTPEQAAAILTASQSGSTRGRRAVEEDENEGESAEESSEDEEEEEEEEE